MLSFFQDTILDWFIKYLYFKLQGSVSFIFNLIKIKKFIKEASSLLHVFIWTLFSHLHIKFKWTLVFDHLLSVVCPSVCLSVRLSICKLFQYIDMNQYIPIWSVRSSYGWRYASRTRFIRRNIKVLDCWKQQIIINSDTFHMS